MEDRIIDKLLNKEIGKGNIKWKIIDIAFVICLFLFAFMIRWKLMPIESADYYGFLKEWMNTIRENGGFHSLSMEISNYTSPYMYIMTLLSYISANDLYALKLTSVFFDYMAAFAVFKILYRMTGSKGKAIFGMAILLLSPAVILDSAYWCQCDIIYTSFLLWSFYYFLKDNSRKSAIFFGVSFIFKLQSVFLLPFFIIMWLKKRTIKLRHYLYVPVIYVISIIPAWIAGRSFQDLITIYLNQSNYYPWGTLNYPNIYALLGEEMPDLRHANEVSGAGTIMAIMILGCIAYYLYTKKVRLTNELIVTLALFTVAITVYSLPHMHDRYGFLIDLLAIIYGVNNVRKLPVTCGFTLVSVVSFMPFLIGTDILPLRYTAILLLCLIVYVGYDLYRQIQQNVQQDGL
ncbi:MAG: hypothetical protein MR992_03970 [Lachnospiraceae bacterium]|nr:hypothetical protein [Lachnospiraceae bacterium]MDD7627573.1 hypothetical protein [Lachnospiraceae bacterium]MDY4120244.1 hypothetical protein [Lachnospiraceae bacterium]